jgi:hypothetical protein
VTRHNTMIVFVDSILTFVSILYIRDCLGPTVVREGKLHHRIMYTKILLSWNNTFLTHNLIFYISPDRLWKKLHCHPPWRWEYYYYWILVPLLMFLRKKEEKSHARHQNTAVVAVDFQFYNTFLHTNSLIPPFKNLYYKFLPN